MQRLLTLFILVVSSTPLLAQVLGTQLASWDFANGIPANWQNGSTSGIGVWEYRGPNTVPNNTVCSRGSCGTGTLPPASVSLANGFVIFDSNYWDDADNLCGGLGSGVDPAPHTAWLITNPINLSTATGAVITFQQQVRMFQASTRVQVSTNDGATWTDVIVNTVNNSPNVEWRTGNISAIAAGQSNVRFRFLFTGTYYHWCLDDITVYQPNQNDLMLNSATYTLFGDPMLATNVSDMQYDQYPQFMTAPFNFKAQVTNVGSQSATNVQATVGVLNSTGTSLYSQTSNTVNTLNAGAQTTLSIANSYNPPTAPGDYRITYHLNMAQADQNPPNNRDTLDFTITSNTYARDEGPMQSVFVPQSQYLGQRHHVGNLYEIRTPGYQLNSIAAAVGTGTAPGTVVKGYVYNSDLSTILAESNPYTINQADINTPGEEKIIILPFSTPFPVADDSIYCVMIGNVNPAEVLRVCRSGNSPDNTSFVRYPDNFGLFYLITTPVVRMNLFPLGVISGCTDPEAANYNPTATLDDDSCLYPGCTNPLADNYDADANFDDGSCVLAGCTNPLADNYNPAATDDDGSCLFPGCVDPDAANFDPQANVDDGSCLYPGCLDPAADNFDPGANVDDGSCLYSGCTDPEADNYDPQANVDDASCLYFGCTDPEADNYYPQANAEDGSCVFTVAAIFTFDTAGCAPYTINVLNQTAVIDGSFCTFTISDGTITEGCQQSFLHTFTEPGEYYVTMLYTTTTGDSEDTIGPIVVSGYPDTPVITEDGTAIICSNCEGQELTWTHQGSLVAGAAGSTLEVANPEGIYQNGYYAVTSTNEGGCSSTSDPLLVLHAQFSLSQESGCLPFDIVMDDLTVPVDGMTCVFDVDGLLIPSQGGTLSISVNEPGPIPITLTCSLDGESDAVTQTVMAYATNVPNLLYDGIVGEVTCTNCEGQSTVWSVNGTQVATDVSVLSVLDGLVSVVLTAEGGCVGEGQLLVISVGEQESAEVLLFPNPASHAFSIQSGYVVSRCEVMDAGGRIWLDSQPMRSRFEMDTHTLSPGFYFVRLQGSGGTRVLRLVVAH